MQTGMYGLPPAAQGGEEGLPTGELFEIIPIPGNGSADLLIEIKVIASIGTPLLLHKSRDAFCSQLRRRNSTNHDRISEMVHHLPTTCLKGRFYMSAALALHTAP